MGLSYNQVYLKPRYSPHNSRSEIDVSVKFGPQKFRIPVVPSNMACTINTKLARWMSENEYFYIMHRFGTKPESKTPEACWEDNYQFVKEANNENQAHKICGDSWALKSWKTISISIGVQEGDKDLLKRCADNGLRIDYLTIDIAHAHSVRMEKMLEFVRGLKFVSHTSSYGSWTSIPLENKPFIIAGNVATPEAVDDIESWGADCTKVGIAQGGACTTYGQTGFGVPMFTCMLECSSVATKPLIADGGIRFNGDISKAIRAGGDMIMAGGFFAASIDSPAETVTKLYKTGELTLSKDGYIDRVFEKQYKRYYGSASSYNKHTDKHIEGQLVELECDEQTYEQKLRYIEEHLQSAISYAGDNLKTVGWGTKNN